jgi:hypothetical protein
MSADNDFSTSRIAIRQKEMRLFTQLERWRAPEFQEFSSKDATTVR